MSPSQQFHDHHHHHPPKRDVNGFCPSPLKTNKNSHFIKRSSPPSFSSFPSPPVNGAAAAATKPQQQQRHPVIIYTHSPKVIHTHPRDFMALVQKLTGLSRSDDGGGSERPTTTVKSENGKEMPKEKDKNAKRGGGGGGNDENSSSSVITDENSGSVGCDGQVNSFFLPPILDPSNPYLSNFHLFTPNSTDFLCSNNQPFYNYTDSLFFSPNMRSSVSSSTLEAMNEFREY
ncbi:hypothetical protein L1049_028343 [Liquidambar formosana]|uniref:VQ domain-containing protein n=1 Tax=Liquidambar formosana TaxID=63359 RepID=A0AAP0RIL4_LIQFO